MARKKVKKEYTNDTVSVKQIKDWLRGILEFQKEDWSPNPEQWETIKNKIFNLDETETIQQQYQQQQQQQHQLVDIPEKVQSMPIRQQSSIMKTLHNEGGLEDSNVDSGGSFPQLSENDINARIHAAKSGIPPEGSPRPNNNIYAKFE